jgi:putative addiction module killer protein
MSAPPLSSSGLAQQCFVIYKLHMIEVRQTLVFQNWHKGLRDIKAAKKIAQRIARLEAGLFGDAKFFDGIGELRIDFGPGYRVYFVQKGAVLVVLLCGGDKSSQQRDINTALKMVEEL